MSAGSHTPGPWALIQFGGPQIGNSETKEAVCTMWGDGGQMEANARLIAAAPEMLEALRNLENDDGSIPIAIWEAVRSAIARAEGRS